MTLNTLRLASLLAPLALAVVACSGTGPDVVEPGTSERAQVSLLAVDVSGAGALLRHDELGDSLGAELYSAANGAPIGKKIDAVYENSSRLFLHHRDEGSITVLDLTGKRLGGISGFPTKGDGAMCSMAFSNQSQAWVACYGARDLFQVDAINFVIADTIPMPGVVTNVGTAGVNVFIGIEEADGSGSVVVIHSNDGGAFAIQKTLKVNAPVIYSTIAPSGRDFILLTAGNQGGAKPHLYNVDLESLDILFDAELEAEPLVAYIGKEPNYAGYSNQGLLYLALPAYVAQIGYNGSVQEWLSGTFSVIAVDRSSDLLYACEPGSSVVKRMDIDGNLLPDFTVPGVVNAIFFLGTNRAR